MTEKMVEMIICLIADCFVPGIIGLVLYLVLDSEDSETEKVIKKLSGITCIVSLIALFIGLLLLLLFATNQAQTLVSYQIGTRVFIF